MHEDFEVNVFILLFAFSSVNFFSRKNENMNSKHVKRIRADGKQFTFINEEKLIKAVERYPVLYDRDQDKYNVRMSLRTKVWKTISLELKSSGK